MFVNFTTDPFEWSDFVSLLEVLKWEWGEKKPSTDEGSEHEGRGDNIFDNIYIIFQFFDIIIIL